MEFPLREVFPPVDIIPDLVVTQSCLVDYHPLGLSIDLKGFNALPDFAEAERSGLGYKDHEIGSGYSLYKRT